MRTDGNEFQAQDRLRERRDTGVTEWARHWNHWGASGALRCHCAGKESDSPFVRFREEVDNVRRLVHLLAWIRDQGDVLANNPNF